jgi:hypothetical protein
MVSLDTVINSHLNDASFEMSINNDETRDMAKKRLAFVKHLVFTNRDKVIEDIYMSDEELIEIWSKVNG